MVCREPLLGGAKTFGMETVRAFGSGVAMRWMTQCIAVVLCFQRARPRIRSQQTTAEDCLSGACDAVLTTQCLAACCSLLVWPTVGKRGAMGCATVHSWKPLLPWCASSLVAHQLVQRAHLYLLAGLQVHLGAVSLMAQSESPVLQPSSPTWLAERVMANHRCCAISSQHTWSSPALSRQVHKWFCGICIFSIACRHNCDCLCAKYLHDDLTCVCCSSPGLCGTSLALVSIS